MEKYATLLKLDFETITLIKERINNLPNSGHNPNSVIAATIYQICKLTKQPISMKKVSLVTQVSCVSIQRYNKFYNIAQ
jgi:transcription initiation factor TFIIIB Brf1 subunit/transcription initiation factor TFIIB